LFAEKRPAEIASQEVFGVVIVLGLEAEPKVASSKLPFILLEKLPRADCALVLLAINNKPINNKNVDVKNFFISHLLKNS
jgi:hypothetical protein